jgi:hypothetical protein
MAVNGVLDPTAVLGLTCEFHFFCEIDLQRRDMPARVPSTCGARRELSNAGRSEAVDRGIKLWKSTRTRPVDQCCL